MNKHTNIFKNSDLCSILSLHDIGLSATELLNFAIEKGSNLSVIDRLIELGSDIHSQNEFALRRSAFRGSIDICTYLVEHGADPSYNNFECIKECAYRNNTYVARYLIEISVSKYDVPVTKYINKVFHIASIFCHIDMMKLCIEYGANINYNNGYALQRSAETNNLDNVIELLKLGADPLMNNGSALLWSAYNKHVSVVKYLLPYYDNEFISSSILTFLQKINIDNMVSIINEYLNNQ